MKLRTLIMDELDKTTFTAHDVRKLAQCERCKGIDYVPQMIALPAGRFHGVCIVEMMPDEEILALPKDERRKLRLNETGVELMRKLVELEHSGE